MLKGSVFFFLKKPNVGSRGKSNRIKTMILLHVLVRSLVQDLLSREVENAEEKYWKGIVK